MNQFFIFRKYFIDFEIVVMCLCFEKLKITKLDVVVVLF